MAGKRKITRRFISRLPRGLRTPEEAFRIPILETLIELGGSGHAGEVLDRVESKMNNVLNSYDKEPLPPIHAPRAGETRRNGVETPLCVKG